MQRKGQVAIPSTTIIELSSKTAAFLRSLLLLPFLIYFMKFSSAQARSYFLSSFTQLTWMLLNTAVTANKIYSHILSDESCMSMKERLSGDHSTRPLNVSKRQHAGSLFLKSLPAVWTQLCGSVTGASHRSQLFCAMESDCDTSRQLIRQMLLW